MFKKILVPVDGGDLSTATVARACTFAKEAGAELVFYCAKPGYFPAPFAGEAMFDDMAAYDVFRNAMDKQAETLLNSAAQQAADAGVACTTRSGECAAIYEGIIAAAEEEGCDLLFMASHGRRGASAFLLGSETQKVLTHCKIPVLVYR